LPDEEEGVLPVAEASPEPEESEHQLIPFERIGAAADEDITPATSAQPIPDSVDAEHGAIPEESELDLTPGMLDKNNDPVRLYLREMGSVPLLKRQVGAANAHRKEPG